MGPFGPMKIVVPSGGEAMSAFRAILPEAPVRFSTTTFWRVAAASRSATMRDNRSPPLPGAKP